MCEINPFFIFVTDRKYQPGMKTQDYKVWSVSNTAQEAPRSITCNLGTRCLTRKNAFRISLHVVHGCFPWRCSSPLGGAGIRGVHFSCIPPETYRKGKSSSGSVWHLQPHISLTLCKRNLLGVPQGSPAMGNQDFGNRLLSWPRAAHSASSHPLQHLHTEMCSLAALLGLWLRLCRAWLRSELSQLVYSYYNFDFWCFHLAIY